ncbi:MAG TPA: YigZ family protein [Candidatus Deferrimicrobium sp.]|nr:YigZ family protein [Candidatus Deferrimicrobium sp.]
MHEYYSIARETETEIIIQKSRFISKVMPVSSETEAKEELEKLRLLHREANHNVYAYRIGRVERFSDDGEPSGTAGRPVLEVMRKEELDNILVVVTRYFGGILLGAGGLVRAYTQSAKAGLDAAEKVKLVPYQELRVQMEYSWVNRVQYEAEIRGYLKGKTEYTEQVLTTYLLPVIEVESFTTHLTDISAGLLSLELGELLYQTKKI